MDIRSVNVIISIHIPANAHDLCYDSSGSFDLVGILDVSLVVDVQDPASFDSGESIDVSPCDVAFDAQVP